MKIYIIQHIFQHYYSRASTDEIAKYLTLTFTTKMYIELISIQKQVFSNNASAQQGVPFTVVWHF